MSQNRPDAPPRPQVQTQQAQRGALQNSGVLPNQSQPQARVVPNSPQPRYDPQWQRINQPERQISTSQSTTYPKEQTQAINPRQPVRNTTFGAAYAEEHNRNVKNPTTNNNGIITDAKGNLVARLGGGLRPSQPTQKAQIYVGNTPQQPKGGPGLIYVGHNAEAPKGGVIPLSPNVHMGVSYDNKPNIFVGNNPLHISNVISTPQKNQWFPRGISAPRNQQNQQLQFPDFLGSPPKRRGVR